MMVMVRVRVRERERVRPISDEQSIKRRLD